ncbi:ricin-type beta-trefoil lectin domain protein [Thermopolyspora sp. NPDC052614]|uniref:ricin-type beta-trefoil lectin domain protein n=1 Tax=Thermopolyspora sp. NPDC052614 TaxID=3155682 RepID=UPI003412CBF6
MPHTRHRLDPRPSGRGARQSASGLPDGLSIDAETGMISGTATATGTSKVEVTATGPNGHTSSATFRWQIADGPIVGLDGICADGGDPTSAYACNFTQPQMWTIRSDGRLEVMRQCVTVAGGSRVVGEECGDSAAQVWQREPDGTLRNTATNLCLTAPHSSRGTPLTVTPCTGSDDQVWRLPPASSASLTNPGRQDLALFSHVDIAAGATTAGKTSRKYAATGLPSGLSIDADTGRISGRTDRAGSGAAIVTASDASGAAERITFSWSVHHGNIRGDIRGGNGVCAEVRDASMAENTPIVARSCSHAGEQLWTVRADGSLEALGKCMTAATDADGDDTPIVLRLCGDDDNQRWRQTDHTLRHVPSGKCLTRPSDPEAGLILGACTADDAQRWSLPPTDGRDPGEEDPPQDDDPPGEEPPQDDNPPDENPPGEDPPAEEEDPFPGYGTPGGITHRSGSWCVDIPLGVVGVFDCNHTPPQTWRVNAGGRVLNQETKECMTPQDGRRAAGTPVVLAPCSDDDAAQEWRQQANGTIRNVASGRCLSTRELTHGSPMVLADCAANAFQLWKLPAS